MKKRFMLLLAVLILALSGCSKKAPEETQPVETTAETTVPAETQPELEYVTARVNGVPAVMATLSRGDTVDIVDRFDERHYVIKLEKGYGLVEKNLVRPDADAAYTPWTGYAYQDAALYDNYRLTGSPVKKLASNTAVEVLDDLGWCCLVRYDGVDGYMKQETLSKTQRSAEKSSGSENAGNDGGAIYLQFSGKVELLASITPQKGTISGKATVLADGTDVVLGYFDSDDQIPVIKGVSSKGWLTVYLDGLRAYVSDAYVCTEQEESYETWDGSSKSIISVYEDFWMLGSPVERLNANTVVTVLYELDNCYFVEAGDVMGYVPKNILPVKTESNPDATAPTQPVQSRPTEPIPTEPAQMQPTEPAQTQPTAPAQTQPTEPAQTQPTAPAQTQPTEPTQTQPTEPAQTEPEETTAPTEGDSEETTETEPVKTDPEWTPPVL